MQKNDNSPNWYVYLVRCRDNSLYTGIAKSPEKRVAEHNTDNQLGAKYTLSLIHISEHTRHDSGSRMPSSA